MTAKKTVSFVPFFSRAIDLKKVVRQGWVERSIPHPESVADHSFGVGLLALILADELGADRDKLVRLALVHDLAEVLIGDITPFMKISSKKKHVLEQKAFERLARLLPPGSQGFFSKLFNEALQQTSRESRLVHELDRLELAFQAVDYEKKEHVDLGVFFESVEKDIRHPALQKIFLEILRKRRPRRRKSI